jgi:sulfur carrier protein
MTLLLNGSAVEMADGAGILELLASHGHSAASRGVAVAVNGEVVPRLDWPGYALGEGDEVELLVAVQGG